MVDDVGEIEDVSIRKGFFPVVAVTTREPRLRRIEELIDEQIPEDLPDEQDEELTAKIELYEALQYIEDLEEAFATIDSTDEINIEELIDGVIPQRIKSRCNSDEEEE